MAIESHGMNETLKNSLYFLEVVFTVIYVFEASVKIGALGFSRYIRWVPEPSGCAAFSSDSNSNMLIHPARAYTSAAG